MKTENSALRDLMPSLQSLFAGVIRPGMVMWWEDPDKSVASSRVQVCDTAQAVAENPESVRVIHEGADTGFTVPLHELHPLKEHLAASFIVTEHPEEGLLYWITGQGWGSLTADVFWVEPGSSPDLPLSDDPVYLMPVKRVMQVEAERARRSCAKMGL